MFMRFLCDCYEMFMRFVWDVYEIFMRCLWDVYEICMRCLGFCYEIFIWFLVKKFETWGFGSTGGSTVQSRGSSFQGGRIRGNEGEEWGRAEGGRRRKGASKKQNLHQGVMKKSINPVWWRILYKQDQLGFFFFPAGRPPTPAGGGFLGRY